MRSFFKTFFASFLALVVFTLTAIFTVIGMIAVVSSGTETSIGDKSVLVVDISENYPEVVQEDPLLFLQDDPSANIPSLFTTIRLIEHAAKDDKIKGIYLKTGYNANSWGSSEELRKAISKFKESKKFVFAYAEVMPQSGYYLASAADSIFLHPQGGMEWLGFSSNIIFLKGMLDKLGIEAQVFYAGKFKSATEPFRATAMTAENKLQTSVYLNDLYDHFIQTVANDRKISDNNLKDWANTAAIQTSYDAKKYGLIDGLKYDDEVKGVILNKLGKKSSEKINFVRLGEYAAAVNLNEGNNATDKIAIIYADGDIIDGDDMNGYIASSKYRSLISDIRKNKSIKAVVLRVNSPGGSALASDVIWRELSLLKQEKPLVVSMGNLAASGGYYISCIADSVFANNNTLTGSIGVFGMIPNMRGFFNNKLGITFDGVATGPYANFGSIDRPLNEGERKIFQNGIDTVYAVFTKRVADGRKLEATQVDSIAQGRVWTGKRAIKIGLTDKIGGLQDAISSAAKLAKLSSYQLREYPEPVDIVSQITGQYKKNISENATATTLGPELYPFFQYVQQIKFMGNGPQARLPFEVKIK